MLNIDLLIAYTALLTCIKSFNDSKYYSIPLVYLTAWGRIIFLDTQSITLFNVFQKSAALEHCYCTNLTRLASKFFRLLGNGSYYICKVLSTVTEQLYYRGPQAFMVSEE